MRRKEWTTSVGISTLGSDWDVNFTGVAAIRQGELLRQRWGPQVTQASSFRCSHQVGTPSMRARLRRDSTTIAFPVV